MELEKVSVVVKEKAFARQTNDQLYNENNARERLAALALFLVFAKMIQNNPKGMAGNTFEILVGGKGTPANSLASGLSGRGFAKCGWLVKLIGDRTDTGISERHSLIQSCMGSRMAGKRTQAKVLMKCPFPDIKIYLNRKKPNAASLEQVPMPKGYVEITELSELEKVVEAIIGQIQRQRGQWKEFDQKEAIRRIRHYHLISVSDKSKPVTSLLEEGIVVPEIQPKKGDALPLLPHALMKWRKALLESAQWNSIPLLGYQSIPIAEIFTELYLGHYRGDKTGIRRNVPLYLREQYMRRENCYSVDSVLIRIAKRGIFIGEPGAGKSTLVKWIAHRMNKELTHWRRFPIIIRLRDYVLEAEKVPKLQLLEFFLRGYCGVGEESIRESIGDIERLEHEVGFKPFFLLDGWDEVPPKKRSSLQLEIAKLENYGDTLITSRPSGVPGNIAQNADVICEVGRLSAPAIRSLVRGLCRELAKPDFADHILKQIDLYSGLAEIATNPFTLTLLCQIMCDKVYQHNPMTTATELFADAVRMIQGYHNSEDHLDRLTSKDLELISKASQLMCFSLNGKRIHEDVNILGFNRVSDFDGSPIAQSRLLMRESQFDESFMFLHLQMQEYFAGRSLSSETETELKLLLKDLGDNWAYLEEWKFFAGSLITGSIQAKCFSDYWKNRLKSPDHFGGVYCYAAFVFAEIPANQREHLDLGCDLFHALMRNVKSEHWDHFSIKALIKLDPFRLAEQIRENYEKIPLELVFRFMPPILQRETGLIPWIGLHSNLHWLQRIAPESLAEPENLNEVRAIIRNDNLTTKKRVSAFKLITGYYDECSIEDAMVLLECEGMSHFRFVANYIAEMGGKDAAMFLAKKLICVGKSRNPASYQIEALVYGLRADSLSAIESYSKEYLIQELEEANPNSILVDLILDALANCPMGSEARPILKILEESSNSDRRIKAAKALAKCYDRYVVEKVLKLAITTDDFELQNRTLYALITAKADLSSYADQLMELLESNDIDQDLYTSIVSLVSQSRMNPIIEQRFAKIIISHLNVFNKSDQCSLDYASLDAVTVLPESKQKEAASILENILKNENVDILIRKRTAHVLGRLERYQTLGVLIDVLKNMSGPLKEESQKLDFFREVTNATLKIMPVAVQTLINQSHPHSDILIKEMSKWSEENLKYCFLQI